MPENYTKTAATEKADKEASMMENCLREALTKYTDDITDVFVIHMKPNSKGQFDCFMVFVDRKEEN